MQDRIAWIGDVRGEGLLIGLDLVEDRRTKAPLRSSVTQEIYRRCLAGGLLVMAYGPRVRINPPLVISEEEIDKGLDVFESVLLSMSGGKP